ncbi:hypothetical protein LR48_Vigan10g065800 [Vigna angularis]|uniref:Uncharacterized protein n=1 Tax=Phaseolus angularis TaxID=3914 RepID=A0A0L9VI83_PHAAN|nr:hypothetical protein LR48_Vigan10g065800 [Vigna angularis]
MDQLAKKLDKSRSKETSRMKKQAKSSLRGMLESSLGCILNFATLDEKTGIVTSRRDDRHFEEEGPILCAALDGLKLPSFPRYEVRVRSRCLRLL